MVFYVSSRVTLLFDGWDVQGPVGMALSVLVVMLLTVFYELFKVWRVRLETKSELARQYTPPPPDGGDGSTAAGSSQSELSFRALHVTQTFLHVLQVTLGYMLMLCVMSYNTWIFLAVLAGSGLGYFISFPLLNRS
uniref:Copper transport protein n=1 Tax=Tetraodon nigroviridis TaxID=99883 RepID=H3CCN7_TETNG